MWNTLRQIRTTKPEVVFAQNPSVVLTLFVLLLRPFFGYRFVSDAHFGGVKAYNGSRLFQKTLDFCNRRADLVIVTNEEHASDVKSIGGRPFVCEDPLPDLSKFSGRTNGRDGMDRKKVFFICSFDIDEPYLQAFKAAEILHPEGYRFFVTGKYTKVDIDPAKFPLVNFLGYVPDEDFYAHLFQSGIVLDLTEHEGCMVCGAYEAMSAEKPLVTSDRKVLRDYFTHGTILTQHDAESIAASIRSACRDWETLMSAISEWKTTAEAAHDRKIEELKARFSLASRGKAAA
jgi:glycosyltransferase involved in cell wall biosynthesis